MSVKQSQITKDQFRGDILERNYCAQYDSENKVYTFDFAEMKPELKTALQEVNYYRFASDDIVKVKQAISDYIAKVGPRVSRTPGEKGEITKTAEAQAEIFEKAQQTIEDMELKEGLGDQLTQQETALKQKAIGERDKLLKQKKLMDIKKQRNLLNSGLEEGKYTETDDQLKQRLGIIQITDEDEKKRLKVLPPDLQTLYDNLTALIDAYETVIAFESKSTLTLGEQTQKQNAEQTIQRLGEQITEQNIPDTVEQGKELEAKQKYSNAKALIAQLEGSAQQAKRQLTPEEKAKVDLAKADIQLYESTHLKDRLARIIKEGEITQATTGKYDALRNRLDNNIRNYQARQANLKNNEKESLRKAQEARQAYNTYTSVTSTAEEKTAAQATLDAALQAELNMPNISNFFEVRPPATKGGKRKTKKHKKQMKKNKTRKH